MDTTNVCSSTKLVIKIHLLILHPSKLRGKGGLVGEDFLFTTTTASASSWERADDGAQQHSSLKLDKVRETR